MRHDDVARRKVHPGMINGRPYRRIIRIHRFLRPSVTHRRFRHVGQEIKMHRPRRIRQSHLTQRRRIGTRNVDVLLAKEAPSEIEPIPGIMIAADDKNRRRKRRHLH